MKQSALTLISVMLLFAGCITVNVPLGGGETGPSFQWMLLWDPPESVRTPAVSNSIRVKDLEAAGSYQLSGMVVRHEDGTVSESSDNRWVTRPGAMLSEMLSRDMMAEGSFPAVFRTAVTVNDMLTVEGYVREFGATQVDSTTWIAVLDVDVTLLSDRGAVIVMQENYRYERRMPSSGFEELSRQLSVLSSTWSEDVRSDFMTILSTR